MLKQYQLWMHPLLLLLHCQQLHPFCVALFFIVVTLLLLVLLQLPVTSHITTVLVVNVSRGSDSFIFN